MDPILPYIATAVAALGLGMLLAAHRGPVRMGGVVLGLGGLIWLFIEAGQLPGGVEDIASEVVFLIFALLAVASAVQMITQQRPVYAALFFVLVILATCGMLVLLEAFFMAFALVIVYAGAILITYMFVLMLAQQATDASHAGETPEYERRSRDPGNAAAVAGLFMAIMVAAVFAGLPELPPQSTAKDRLDADLALLANLPGDISRQIGSEIELPSDLASHLKAKEDGTIELTAVGEDGTASTFILEPPGNTAHVGWDLVASFPASLEVAGVILLMAMFGAVVLARREVEHAEQELTAATTDFGESREDQS